MNDELTKLTNQQKRLDEKTIDRSGSGQNLAASLRLVPVTANTDCPAASHSPVSSSKSKSSIRVSATSTSAPTTSAGSSTNSSHGCSSTRSRRINFTANALKAFRLKRLALNNPKLLRKYGITSVQIRNTSNGEALQRFELPKRCSPSPPPTQVKYLPPPQATAFAPIQPPLIGTPNSNFRVAAARGTKVQPKVAMEQRSMAPHQQPGIQMQQGRIDQMMQEPGTSGSCNDTPLLMNLLSNNSQMNSTGNGMVNQQTNPAHQQMNPIMRYPQPQANQQAQMYPGTQQSPHYMQQGNAMAARMMPNNHQMQAMMMQQSGQQMAHAAQQMAPATGQTTEPSPKKRKRQTKKAKAEEEAKKQQTQAQAQSAQMQHPQMMPVPPMQDYYMLSQGGQQRVPPVNMHMTQTQYRMPYQQHMYYQQTSNSIMPGGGPQYPNQHYPQQMWHPNMQQQHMNQHPNGPQSHYYVQSQGNQQSSQQQMQAGYPANVQYGSPSAQPHQSPAPEMKNRIPPPAYNDSMQQYAQRNAFMSPPPQHPNSNFPMQQSAQNQQQMNAMHQNQSQSAQQSHLQHSRAMYDMADNVDDLVPTLSSEADDYDLDSIELDPIRGDGMEMNGPQGAQANAQYMNQHPNGPQAHYYVQMQQQMPAGYPGNVQAQGHQQQMPSGYPGNVQPQANQQQQMPAGYPGNVHYGSPSTEQFAVQYREKQQKNRELQDKKELEQLKVAMNREPEEPTPPSAEPVPEAQQQSIANTVNSVFEKVMSGELPEDESSSSSSQPPPTTSKRKKQSAAAKTAAAQQAQQPPTPTQLPMQHGIVYQQTPPPSAMYQHPGTPTGFAQNQPSTPQQYYYPPQRIQQMRQANSSGPMTPTYAPPVSTPDSASGHPTPGFFPPGQQPLHNGAHTPQRSNSLKNVLGNGSNPHTPQTPVGGQMTHSIAQQQINQQHRFNENGGGSSASSAAPTPSGPRASIDEPTQMLNIKEEPQTSGHPPFPQQSPYAQFNGHGPSNQHFSFHSNEDTKHSNAINSIATSSSVVSLKSHNVDSNAELCTPPSANAVSSATPTTASQQNHVDSDAMQQQQPQLNDLQPSGIKIELNDEKREILEHNESDQLVGNGPTNPPTATTSTVAE
ncbi:hypothetical protein M3Y95_00732000 [Aphelenchoides besseyi]|nr:hypothetical protein M3Y95_00732000 [Aphelenchoides besseyi]